MTEPEMTEQGMTEPDVAEQGIAEPEYTVSGRTKYILVGAMVVLAFFAAYGFAAARGPGQSGAGASAAAGAACAGNPGGQAAASGAACTGCESTAPAVKPQAAAVLSDGVQKIDVDVSAGYFDPTVIEVAAGVPTEITFSQGSGCLAQVAFPDFGIEEDLTQGGAVVLLPALEAGEYGFNCGMEMVFGTVVAQ